MSENEEALDDFPTENPITTAEFMVGTYRAESTNEWAAKNPPSYDGSTSWFKYEEPSLRIGLILQCLKLVNEDQH